MQSNTLQHDAILFEVQKMREEQRTIALMASKEILTLDELVLYTGYSKDYIYKLTHFRKIPYYKGNGQKLFFKKKEIEEYLCSQRVPPTSDSEQQAIIHTLTR